MGGFNIGGFTQGLAGGLGTGQALRRGRQDEKLRELISEQIGDEGIARQRGMESIDMPTSEFALEDPYLFRLFDKIKNRGATKVDPAFDPGATAVDPEDDPAVTPGVMQRANGGAIRRYGLGGSVMARGPQMTGNPDPRMAAPMGGGMQGMAQQAMQQRSALGGGMQQPGGGGQLDIRGLMQQYLQQQQGRQQPQPQPMPQQPMGGGMQGMAQQAMQQRSALGGGMQPRPFEGGGGMNPKMGGGAGGLQPAPPPVQQGVGMQPGARAALPRNPGVQQFASGGMIPFAPQRYASGGMIPFAPQAYKEGGEVSEEEEIRRRAAKNRERRPSRVEGRTEEARGADRTAKPEPKASAEPKRSALPKTKKPGGIGIDKLGGVQESDTFGRKALGRVKGVGKGLGIGYALGAMGEGSADSMATPTEDMYGEYKMDPSKASLPRDLGVRALGTMERVGRALIPDAMEPYLGMRMEHDPVELSQSVRDEMEGNIPAEGEDEPVATGGGPAADRPPAPPDPRLVPKAGAGPQQPGTADIDFSGANPAEVPNFTTQDWVKHRKASLEMMVAKGVPIAEAMEKIDQQITGMQQRNFANYATQGLALLQAGDMNGAQSALRAAFQYFPSGSDVKFGTQNGQMFGIGVNEKTGKPEGKPFPITPESINAVVTNFQKPGAWNEWAQDQRDFQQLLREYEEVKKPYSEAIASAALTGAEADVRGADARLATAAGAGAGGGTDRRAAATAFASAFNNVEGLDVGPELARGLSSAAMQVWDMNQGQVAWPQIVEVISRAARIGDPKLRKQIFAKMGLTDPVENIGPE